MPVTEAVTILGQGVERYRNVTLSYRESYQLPTMRTIPIRMIIDMGKVGL